MEALRVDEPVTDDVKTKKTKKKKKAHPVRTLCIVLLLVGLVLAGAAWMITFAVQNWLTKEVGGDTQVMRAWEAGAVGFVSGCANAVPWLHLAMEAACSEGGTDRDRQACQAHLDRAADAFRGVKGIAAIKRGIAQSLPGYPEGVRLPLLSLTDEDRGTVDELNLGLEGSPIWRMDSADKVSFAPNRRTL